MCYVCVCNVTSRAVEKYTNVSTDYSVAYLRREKAQRETGRKRMRAITDRSWLIANYR